MFFCFVFCLKVEGLTFYFTGCPRDTHMLSTACIEGLIALHCSFNCYRIFKNSLLIRI